MRAPYLTLLAAFAFPIAAVAAPPTWIINKGASRVTFVAAMNGEAINGEFRAWDSKIAFNPNDLAASSVTATISVASARTGEKTRDEALPTSDWFAAKMFPRATFLSHKITAIGSGRYVASGTLTIRNETRPVDLPFTLAITGDTARMNGALTLDRSEFGVGQGQWRGGDTVALKVLVKVAVSATRGS